MSSGRLAVTPPLPLDVYIRRPAHELPFPLNHPGVAGFAKGRHALWHGLTAFGLAPTAELLVPAYNCGSEVEAILRAQIGCRFYNVTSSLKPDECELEALLDDRVVGLYLIHYLGFPQDAPRWRRWCDERHLLLVEDAAQAWLTTVEGKPVGSYGDLAIFSFYKFFGVGDGAALVGGPESDGGRHHRELGLRSLAERNTAWLLSRSELLARFGSHIRPELPLVQAEFDPEEGFALGDPSSRASRLGTALLSRAFDPTAADRRRANYRWLFNELPDLVPPAFASVPEGACPFVFPIETKSKLELLERLVVRGVRALDFWSVPHPAQPVEHFPSAASWRNRVVGLPVHQELRDVDLERLVSAVRAAGARRTRSRVEVGGIEDIPAADWARLAEDSRNIFATREWLSLWWQHFGRGKPLVARAFAPDGRLVAVLPLYRWTSHPPFVLRFLGHGPGDELGPICAPQDRPAAARGLVRALDLLAVRWDVLLAEHLPGSGWGALLGARVLRHHANPVLRFESDDWDDFMASRSRNFREQVRRRERRLCREHQLAFRLSDRTSLQADLDVLFNLHAARWADGTSAFGGAREAFHREFAAVALERGWLRLWLLELDGRSVAAWYGLRFAGRESYYQSGRNPSFDRLSVGWVLLVHSIRSAMQDGLKEYRFLRGDDPYKYRFASDDPGLETVALAGSAAGKLLVSAGGATRRLERFPAPLRRPLGL